jgi:CHAT domain-containing protein
MFLTLLIGLLQISIAATDSNLVEQSKSQANYYLSNIEQQQNVEENLWALAILTNSHPEVRRVVEEKVQSGNYSNNQIALFQNIEDSYSEQLKKIVLKTGSDQLLTELLLITDENQKDIYEQFSSKFKVKFDRKDIDFKKLFEAIINKDTIDESIVSTDTFTLTHLFLLYRAHNQLTDSLLTGLTKNWSKKNNNDQNLFSTLYNASYLRALYLKYDYGQTAPLYNHLIKDTLLPNSNLRLKVYRYLDYSMYRLGLYDRSLKIVRQKNLPLANYLNKEKERISIKQLQGVYLYSIGKIKAAEQIYREVLNEINSKSLNIPRSSIYNNLALTYHKSGKYDQYLNLQFRALEKAEQSENFDHQLEIANNLFIYYRELNNSELALKYLSKAQKLAQKSNKKSVLGTIYMSFGSFYRKFEKDFEKSHEYYSKSEKILSSLDNIQRYVQLLNEQAESYLAENKYVKSIRKNDAIINLTKKEKGQSYIDALINKAQIYLKKKNITQAKALIEKFKSFDLNQLDFNQIVKAKKVEAEYLYKTGQKNEALDILKPTLNQIVIRAQSSTDLKSGFWHVEDEYLDAFELATSIYMDTGQPGKAIEKLDQLKTINDASLYQNPLVKSSLLNESELTEYKQITNQLDVVRKKLLTAPEDEKFGIRQQINQLNTKKRKYDRKLSKNIDLAPTSIRQIQNKLSARELLLHITELKDTYYIAKISRTDIDLKTIKLDKNMRNLFSTAAQQIATHETNLDSLYKISQLLELKEIPAYVNKVTLVPDSYFYQLPLDILPLEKPAKSYSYGEATYAIEKFKTQYLTTLEEFKTPNRSSSTSKEKMNYVGYGVSNFDNYSNQSLVPLPYAQSEVIKIAQNLTNLSRVETYTNEQSTKSTFMQTAPYSRVIHLATHSEVSERDPMFSTVYFDKATADSDSTFDDRFFAYELFELDLSNEMVMLNSCESGSGSYIQGTGVMGISRALRYAGAESLILNLWSVNDMLASEFAVQFYSNLNEGKSKAEALRAAKKHFLNTNNADPHFWGPYMLIGNTDPIVAPQQNKNMAMAGTFIFYFLLMVGLSYLSQRGIIFSKQ